jgi:hypothetical protein
LRSERSHFLFEVTEHLNPLCQHKFQLFGVCCNTKHKSYLDSPTVYEVHQREWSIYDDLWHLWKTNMKLSLEICCQIPQVLMHRQEDRIKMIIQNVPTSLTIITQTRYNPLHDMLFICIFGSHFVTCSTIIKPNWTLLINCLHSHFVFRVTITWHDMAVYSLLTVFDQTYQFSWHSVFCGFEQFETCFNNSCLNLNLCSLKCLLFETGTPLSV